MGEARQISVPLISSAAWLPLKPIQMLVSVVVWLVVVVVVMCMGWMGIIPWVTLGENGPHILKNGEMSLLSAWWWIRTGHRRGHIKGASQLVFRSCYNYRPGCAACWTVLSRLGSCAWQRWHGHSSALTGGTALLGKLCQVRDIGWHRWWWFSTVRPHLWAAGDGV